MAESIIPNTLNEQINQLTKTFTGVMAGNGWQYVSKDVYGFGNIPGE